MRPLRGCHDFRRRGHRAAVATNCLAQCLTQATEQMPAIGHLDGSWRPAPCSLGINSSAITRDNLDPWPALQPVGHAIRVAIGQQIKNAISLQVADDRSVALSAPPRPIVDAHDRRGNETRHRRRPDHPQQCIAAHRHRQPMGEAGARLTARYKSYSALALCKPIGALRPRSGDPGQSLREYLHSAIRRPAAKAPRREAHRHNPSMPGQIGEMALVMAMHAARVPSATGARGGTLNWPHIQMEPPVRCFVATDNRQTCRNGRNRRRLDHEQIPSLTVIPTLCTHPIRV